MYVHTVIPLDKRINNVTVAQIKVDFFLHSALLMNHNLVGYMVLLYLSTFMKTLQIVDVDEILMTFARKDQNC